MGLQSLMCEYLEQALANQVAILHALADLLPDSGELRRTILTEKHLQLPE